MKEFTRAEGWKLKSAVPPAVPVAASVSRPVSASSAGVLSIAATPALFGAAPPGWLGLALGAHARMRRARRFVGLRRPALRWIMEAAV